MGKGQVTIFLVLGIVIVIVIIGGFYLASTLSEASLSKEKQTAIELSEEEAEIASEVEDCLYYTSGEALLLVSKNGGYFSPPKKSFAYSNYVLPLYYDEGEELVPSIQDIEKQLAKAIEYRVRRCVPASGKHLVEAAGEPSAEVSLADGMDVSLVYPFKITSNDGTSSLITRFSASLDIDFEKAYNNAIGLYSKQKEAKVQFFVDIGETAVNEDYVLKLYNQNNITFYILEFNGLEFEGEKMEYSFAIKPVIDLEELKREGFLKELEVIVEEMAR
ncbi:MAG: hypothetical protein ABIB71_01350 [Candidatus Woesearchaeota archaeon]